METNKRLIQFKELKEAVITNIVKVEQDVKSKKKEQNTTLLSF